MTIYEEDAVGLGGGACILNRELRFENAGGICPVMKVYDPVSFL
jgi:hypothetical protein